MVHFFQQIVAFFLIGFCYVLTVTLSVLGQERSVRLSDLNGKWTLAELQGKPVLGDTPIFFRLEGEVLSGFDGCNTFAGPVLQPERIRSTGRGCAENYTMLPLDLGRPAEHLLKSRHEDGRLILPVTENSHAVFVKTEDQN